MASAALEKSLDEIIGDRPSQPRRGSGRPTRGTRPAPYSRDSRDSRPLRRDDDRRRPYGDADGDRWSHDRYDQRSRYNGREQDDRAYRPARDDREGRPTRLRISNIHYDLSEAEVRDLFERIAPVARFNMHFDRAGRSEGTAMVSYDRYSDAKLAVSQYDGQSALGQRLEVDFENAAPPARRGEHDLASRISRGPRDGRDERRDMSPRPRGRGRGAKPDKPASSARRGPVTAEDLDAELDSYINQRNNGDGQKPSGEGTASDADGMVVD